MHINTSESSRTARSHKNTDSCPEKEYSMTIIQFIITQNYRQENEKCIVFMSLLLLHVLGYFDFFV